MTVTSFLSIGMVLVIATGGIDLSVGKLAGFVSVVVCVFAVLYLVTTFSRTNPCCQPCLSVICWFAGWHCGRCLAGLFHCFPGIAGLHRDPGRHVAVQRADPLGDLPARPSRPTRRTSRLLPRGYIPPIWGWIIFVVILALLIWNVFSSRRARQKYGFPLRPLYLDLLRVGHPGAVVPAYVFSVNAYKGIPIPVFLLAMWPWSCSMSPAIPALAAMPMPLAATGSRPALRH